MLWIHTPTWFIHGAQLGTSAFVLHSLKFLSGHKMLNITQNKTKQNQPTKKKKKVLKNWKVKKADWLMTWRMTWQWAPWVLFVFFCFVFLFGFALYMPDFAEETSNLKHPWSQKNSLPSRKRPWQNLLCLTRGSRKEQPGKTDNLWQLPLYSRQKQRSNSSPTPSSRGWTGSLELPPRQAVTRGSIAPQVVVSGRKLGL